MSLISKWSTVANANGTLGSTPFYWPEGQAPSTVNDCARLMMATIRTQWNDAQWFDWGYTVTRVSGNSFSVVTAAASTVTLPAAFEVNGRIKLYDTSTLYGTITTVSASAASTLVTFTPDAHSLTASFSSVYNSILTPTNTAIPGLTIPTNVITQQTQQIFGIDNGATNSSSFTLTPALTSYVTGQMINFKAAAPNTGPVTVNIDGLGPITIKKQFNQNLATGDIFAGQIVTVVYDGTNFELQSLPASGAGGGAGELKSFQILTSGTAQTYTRPAGISTLLIQMIGAGGGGGGVPAVSSQSSAAGGGGGGGFAQKFITSAAATYIYTIGAGGAGGDNTGSNGSNGGDTTFGTITAGGGTFGHGDTAHSVNAVGGSLGDGGTSSGGDINASGGPGQNGWSLNSSTIAVSGGGGGSQFSPPGVENRAIAGGAVGASSAANSGRGGAGALSQGTNVSGFAGGAGGSGMVIVWEFS